MKKIICVLVASTLFTSSLSYAQWIVNDPVHTYQSALNTAQLIKAEYTRLEQLRNQIEQLKNLGNLNSWKGKTVEEINALRNYVTSLKTIYGDIGAQTGRLRQRLDQAKIAKLSYQEYMQLQQQRVKEGDEEAVRRHDDDIRALKKTEADYADVQNWESQIDGSLTQMGSAQMMNQQLNKLIAQNSETLKVLVATRFDNRDDEKTKEAERSNAQVVLQTIKSERAKKQVQIHQKSISSLPKSPLEKQVN